MAASAAGYQPEIIPTANEFRKVTKLMVYIRKKPGLSDAEFVRHSNLFHAPLARAIALKYKCISYSISYSLERDRQTLKQLLHDNVSFLDYDALCTFVFQDYLALARFLGDKDGASLANDQKSFMDAGVTKFMVGDEYVLIDAGNAVPHSR